MWNQKWSVIAAILCLQCGGSTQSAAPVEEPEGETEAAPAETKETAPAEGAASGEEPAAGEGSSSSGGGAAQPSAKKPCKELDKSTCKITTGCAWNDVHKCVEEGAPE